MNVDIQDIYDLNMILLIIGNIHKRVAVMVCHCESTMETLIRHNLWPATPADPQLAISIKFLEAIRCLRIECRTSLHAILGAFRIAAMQPWQEQVQCHF